MNLNEVKENLCYYDKRNPYNYMDDEDLLKLHLNRKKNREDCHCDNCFNRRTKLAEELLKYLPF